MATEGRPLVVGNDDGPEAPFPYQMEGKITTGFQRGSTLIGFPTANLPISLTRTPWINEISTGVYFGWSALRLPTAHADNPFTSASSSSSTPALPSSPSTSPYALYPMVMSIGYNPYFKNTVRTAEALIEDIRFDTRVAGESLKRKTWAPKGVPVVGGWEEGELDVQWLIREQEDYDEPEEGRRLSFVIGGVNYMLILAKPSYETSWAIPDEFLD
ncbi:unnamed protein product [Parascedosporium putredinis]|uniref:Riboflavin kinase n=1 Tax=Parascedosporium putredinis TaxID=1442378 RepID=A0A9P1HCC9_9PEZI|nr:unnamed protein product [Parascedosporium putredinis]CAI8004615.1 unnamed protein product [Parascedosporium putredinis]